MTDNQITFYALCRVAFWDRPDVRLHSWHKGHPGRLFGITASRKTNGGELRVVAHVTDFTTGRHPALNMVRVARDLRLAFDMKALDYPASGPLERPGPLDDLLEVEAQAVLGLR